MISKCSLVLLWKNIRFISFVWKMERNIFSMICDFLYFAYHAICPCSDLRGKNSNICHFISSRKTTVLSIFSEASMSSQPKKEEKSEAEPSRNRQLPPSLPRLLYSVLDWPVQWFLTLKFFFTSVVFFINIPSSPLLYLILDIFFSLP